MAERVELSVAFSAERASELLAKLESKLGEYAAKYASVDAGAPYVVAHNDGSFGFPRVDVKLTSSDGSVKIVNFRTHNKSAKIGEQWYSATNRTLESAKRAAAKSS